MTDKPMTFGSLFAGIGGIDLGLERAGWECKWQVEIDPYCQKVLAKHWPDVARWDYVTTFPPDGRWSVDLIAGGFPCQEISVSGKREGIGGKRSGLFYEVVRIAERLRPRFILLENVSALLVRGMGEVLRELAAIGFYAEWHCVPAAAFGAPHRRDRVFILAHTKHNGCAWHGTNEHKCECKKMGGHQQSRRDGGDRDVADTASSGLQRSREPEHAGDYTPFAEGQTIDTIYERFTHFWCIEPEVGRVAHGVPSRMDRLRGLGNAVVPQVAEFFGALLAKVLRSETDDD